MRSVRSLTVALALTLTACADDPAGPEEVVPSVLVDDLNERGPEVGAHYRAGHIHVDVTTYRNGCADEAGEDVSYDVDARRITIRMYDRLLPLVCFPEPAPESRGVTVLALAHGTWTIRVEGSRVGAGPVDPEEPYRPYAVEVEVQVD